MSALKKNEKFKIHSFRLVLFATPARNARVGSGAKATQKTKAKNFQIFYSHSQTLTRL